MSESPDPFAPARLGPLQLRNRIIKAATFEGMTGGQEVSDRLVAFHRAAARGGVGMTTVAFLAADDFDGALLGGPERWAGERAGGGVWSGHWAPAFAARRRRPSSPPLVR